MARQGAVSSGVMGTTIVVAAFPGHEGGRVENPLTRALDERGKYRAPFCIASFLTASSPPLPSPAPPPPSGRAINHPPPLFSFLDIDGNFVPWRHTIAATPTAPMKTGGEHRSGGRGRSNSIFLGFFYVLAHVSKCFIS
uniref:Uncharacterized protein n=1 Tax=Oryza barthii TaxID=65489 RepID=A0A0D3EPP1_9ORYZ